MKTYRLSLLPGDGIGPEVINASVKIMDKAASLHNVKLDYREVLVGGIAIDSTGEPLPDVTVESCRMADAILFGTVGGAKWDFYPHKMRPEYAILSLRKKLGMTTQLQPFRIDNSLINSSPLKPSITKRGIDFLLVRELMGINSFNRQQDLDNQEQTNAYDVLYYTEEQVRRFAISAFEIAMTRPKKHLTSIDKANVLESSLIWRKVFVEVASKYPSVTVDYLYTDTAISYLINHPEQFDVIVTDTLSGDFISDLAGACVGSMALTAVATLSPNGKPSMFGGTHGSAETIAGQDVCNPIATILSAALLMRWGLNELAIADCIERAVAKTLKLGYRTADIMPGEGGDEYRIVGTSGMVKAILSNMEA